MRILIVEDDLVLADGLKNSLIQSGYAVDLANNGADADSILTYEPFDLLVLDLGLPKISGFEVLKRLRARANKMPVLILTANDNVEDRVKGLDLGADDYLSKPFVLAELEARVRALIRRGQAGGSALISLGELSFDSTNRVASYQNVPLSFSSRELALLEILMLKLGKVVSKQQIIDKLCNFDDDLTDNALEVSLHRLRKKLEETNATIRTVRGLGYLLEEKSLAKKA